MSDVCVFEAIDRFAADLRSNTPNSASLDDISSALEKMLTMEASAGVKLNVLDSQEGVNDDLILEMKTVFLAKEGLDYA